MDLNDGVTIECPKCQWKPDGGRYWKCTCGTHWDTFETTGICPNCNKRWKDTQCPGPGYPGGCGSWSPHIDWYKGLDELIRIQIEESLNETVEIPNSD